MAPAFFALGFGNFIGNIDTVSAILYIAGIILLFVEMFIPGFGIAGGIGTALIIVGIIMTATSVLEAVLMFLILLALVALVLVLILRSAKKGKLSKKLILRSAATRGEGFSASEDTSSLVGFEGVAATKLRPAGTGEFDGKRLDVVSDGEFIEPGSKIKITSAQGRKIVVKSIK
jgi:membrane-bound ClpP family serine protease